MLDTGEGSRKCHGYTSRRRRTVSGFINGRCFGEDDGNWSLIPLKLDKPGSYLSLD